MRLPQLRRASLWFLPLLAAAVALAQTPPPPDIDSWVLRAMKEFEVPGVAVGILKDGQVVHAKGYGVRKLGAPEPVDERTLFGIASNTKAFTAAALAMLVDEGKLAWDDPVEKHLPAFRLYDPYVTRELTVRDLLCHRSGLGLGAGDLLFWPDTLVSREEVLAAARYIRPASSFRSRYAYNNLMFVVAGQVVAAASGKSWDQFVRERIFEPLGMRETTIAAGAPAGANLATPHSRGWRLQGALAAIQPTRDETWAAAAGIRSSVAELASWVQAQLDGGRYAGKRLWSEAAAREMWSPQTIIPIGPLPPALKSTQPNFSAYGLGWNLRDYQGRKVVSHGGGLTGMITSVLLVPQEKLGILVFTNQEEGGACSAIAYHILDHYLKLTPLDWIEAFHSARRETLARAAAAEKKQAEARARGTRPSLGPEGYAAEYSDAWYGKAVIRQENGHLVLSMARTPAMVGELEHWHHDTFLVRWRDNTIPDALATFWLGRDGKVDRMTMAAASTLADFSFDYHDLLFRPTRKK